MTGAPFNTASHSAWDWAEPTNAQWASQQQSLKALQWDVFWMDLQEWFNGNGKYWVIGIGAILLLGKGRR